MAPDTTFEISKMSAYNNNCPISDEKRRLLCVCAHQTLTFRLQYCMPCIA